MNAQLNIKRNPKYISLFALWIISLIKIGQITPCLANRFASDSYLYPHTRSSTYMHAHAHANQISVVCFFSCAKMVRWVIKEKNYFTCMPVSPVNTATPHIFYSECVNFSSCFCYVSKRIIRRYWIFHLILGI